MMAPFPYFGGKSRAAQAVWKRFGPVDHYVEPFAGSLAVLLARPDQPRVETVNDLDGFVSNFWRACRWAPGKLAELADWPVNENDLHARRHWLRERAEDLVADLEADPFWFDLKAAAWWVWGKGAWIGRGWPMHNARILPHLADIGRGVHALGRRERLPEIFEALADRLRYVRVASGDWTRVVTPAVLCPQDYWTAVGVFLDPPYTAGANRDASVYSVEDLEVGHDVHAWAVDNGDDPRLRIAVCGYAGEYDWPDGWTEFSWKAQGGMGNMHGGDGQGSKNRHRERIWFSPHCLELEDRGARAVQSRLFDPARGVQDGEI